MNPFNRIKYNAPVILTFSLAAFAVLLISMFTDGTSTLMLFSIHFTTLLDPFFYLRLFTHVLGHADMNHFLNNFVLILLVGPMLEEKYGSRLILIMMGVTAFITGLLHIIFASGVMLGASGIVFTFMLLGSFTNVQRGRIPLTFILALVVFLGREVMSSMSAEITNIAYMAHIAGGLCGATFGFLFNKRGRRI